jgi:hypothetical protein
MTTLLQIRRKTTWLGDGGHSIVSGKTSGGDEGGKYDGKALAALVSEVRTRCQHLFSQTPYGSRCCV